MNKRNTYIVVIVLIVLAVAFGYMFWPQISPKVDEGGAGELFNQAAENPFDESSNPYADIKTNPFE